MSDKTDDLLLRHPKADEGYAVNQLVAANPPLDTNSVYCNLLQCSHFAGTAMSAWTGGELVGFVSGYRLPETPEVLFVWQLVVDARARGLGLAKRLIKAQLAADACAGVRYIHTTITPDNEASWGVFNSLARDLGAELKSAVHFERSAHFGGQHDDEHLLVIGPFAGH